MMTEKSFHTTKRAHAHTHIYTSAEIHKSVSRPQEKPGNEQ